MNLGSTPLWGMFLLVIAAGCVPAAILAGVFLATGSPEFTLAFAVAMLCVVLWIYERMD